MDTLAQFPTRRALLNHLEIEKLQGRIKNIEAYEHDLWVKWARARRAFRLVTVFHALLAKAERMKTTTYGDLAEIIDLGSANELNLLINHIGKLCAQNKWPKYPVLIKNQKTGKVGNGFFTFFDPAGTEFPTQADKDAFENQCEQECYDRPLPDQVAMLCRLAEYVHLHLE